MNKQFFDLIKKASPTAILIAILLYFGNIYLSKIQKIETQLLSIKMQLAELKIKLIPAEQLRDEIKKAIETHERIYHNKK